ncbi:tetratricopeptide repeat protein [Streptosporangium saharense]|uniref:tetratricopeptide repeat protein n=1 Tax=Streptosporangium saharense TaxID=1706840 RepID=UPI003417A19F
MDAGLVWTVVGSLAGVIAVVVAMLQLRAQPPDGAQIKRKWPGQGGAFVVSSILRPPLGHLPTSFMDREHLIRKLWKVVRRPDGNTHVLWGLGGVGKTAISLKVARKSLEHGYRVWWISASSESEVTASMLDIARSLGASDGQIREALVGGLNPADLLWGYLEHQKKWLMILDNVDDIRILTVNGRNAGSGNGWLRPSRSGIVLVSSRLGDGAQWGSFSRLHHVETLDAHNSALLLRNIAPEAGSYDEAKMLAGALGFLPLALHHAGSFLASPWSAHRKYSEYLNAAQNYPASLVGEGTKGLAATWESSLDILGDQGVGQARPILRILSCFAGAVPIPMWFLSIDVLTSICDDRQAVLQGLDVLAKVGLVDVHDTKGKGSVSLTVHPLVAEANRLYLGQGEESGTVVSVSIDLISVATESLDPENPEHLTRWLEILPHITSSLASLAPYLDGSHMTRLARACSFMASSMIYSGHYEAGLRVVNIAIMSMSRENSGCDQEHLLSIRHERAAILSYTGELRLAEQEYRSVAEAKKRIYGFNHRKTQYTLYELVRVMSERGLLSEALELGRQVWEIRESLLGVDHPQVLKTGALVAKILLKQGNAEECLQICETLLQRRSAGGGGDRDVLMLSLRSLRAQALAYSGKLEKARLEFVSVIENRSSILRSGHPDILESRYHLAQVLYSSGRAEDARRELRDVQSSARANLPSGHPFVATINESVSAL